MHVTAADVKQNPPHIDKVRAVQLARGMSGGALAVRSIPRSL